MSRESKHHTPSSRPPSTKHDYQDLFAVLQQEITTYSEMLKSVLHFKEVIVNGQRDGLFDDQDLAWLEKDIEDLSRKREERLREFEKRKDLYENSIVRLEDILDKRKAIIEEADQSLHVFQNRPDLLQKFAQKRAVLIKTVEQAKTELQQPVKFQHS